MQRLPSGMWAYNSLCEPELKPENSGEARATMPTRSPASRNKLTSMSGGLFTLQEEFEEVIDVLLKNVSQSSTRAPK